MIDYEHLRVTVVKGLKKYLSCPIIRTHQNVEPPPYPYVSYTITTLATENKGTHGEYSDGMARKPVSHIWSITVNSDDNFESVTLANKARDWLDYVGTKYLNDNDVIVQSLTGVTNRDNILTVEYEYRNGFDCFFTCFDEVVGKITTTGTVDSVTLNNTTIVREDPEDINSILEKRLDGTI